MVNDLYNEIQIIVERVVKQLKEAQIVLKNSQTIINSIYSDIVDELNSINISAISKTELIDNIFYVNVYSFSINKEYHPQLKPFRVFIYLYNTPHQNYYNYLFNSEYNGCKFGQIRYIHGQEEYQVIMKIPLLNGQFDKNNLYSALSHEITHSMQLSLNPEYDGTVNSYEELNKQYFKIADNLPDDGDNIGIVKYLLYFLGNKEIQAFGSEIYGYLNSAHANKHNYKQILSQYGGYQNLSEVYKIFDKLKELPIDEWEDIRKQLQKADIFNRSNTLKSTNATLEKYRNTIIRNMENQMKVLRKTVNRAINDYLTNTKNGIYQLN